MPKKLKIIQFSVSGGGKFPTDMLRYDGAYPAHEVDSAKIADTFYTVGKHSGIELVATFNAAPKAERWESFGWQVTHVWDGRNWVRYNGQRVTK